MAKLSPKSSKRRKLYLHTIAGRPIKHARDITKGLHFTQLLIQGESWIWGGVSPGFEFNIGIVPSLPNRKTSYLDSILSSSVTSVQESVKMRTLSLTPKALQVVNLLDQPFMDQVIESGRSQMMRSPEVRDTHCDSCTSHTLYTLHI